MESGKRASVSDTRQRGKEVARSEDALSRNLGCSISNITRYVWFEILLLLSVKELLVCRCVCKLWRTIISEVEFAKQYFAKSVVHTLIRPSSSIHVSRILYLVEHQTLVSYVDNFVMKLDTKLYIPLRNSDLGLKTGRRANLNSKSKLSSKQKRFPKLSARDHRLCIVNSCRGLLCLSDPFKNEPIAVCNPITGEYIDLPTPTHGDECDDGPVDCALGFSPQANKYKVIRMFGQEDHQWRKDPITGQTIMSGSIAEIHTVGTRSWRMIGDAPSPHNGLGFATYLNGAIHWLYVDERRSNYIVSFDFVNEKFQPIPPPHYLRPIVNLVWRRNIALGELRGCLCMCVPSPHEISVLVMKDYGVRESWTREFRLTASASFGNWIKDSYKPICISRNGLLLLFQPLSNALYCFEPNGEGFKFLKVCGSKTECEAIAYTPSFISLKDAVVGEDTEVLNIYSRFAGLKLPEEKINLSLEETVTNSDLILSSLF